MLVLAETIWVRTSFCELSSNEQFKVVEMLLNHKDLVLQVLMLWLWRSNYSGQNRLWVLPIA